MMFEEYEKEIVDYGLEMYDVVSRYDKSSKKWNKLYNDSVFKFMQQISSLDIYGISLALAKKTFEKKVVDPWLNLYSSKYKYLSSYVVELVLLQADLEQEDNQERIFELKKKIEEYESKEYLERVAKIEANKDVCDPKNKYVSFLKDYANVLIFDFPQKSSLLFPVENHDAGEVTLTETISIITSSKFYKFFKQNEFGYEYDGFLKIDYFSSSVRAVSSGCEVLESFGFGGFHSPYQLRKLIDVFEMVVVLLDVFSVAGHSFTNDLGSCFPDGCVPAYPYLNLENVSPDRYTVKKYYLDHSYLAYVSSITVFGDLFKKGHVSHIDAGFSSTVHARLSQYLNILTNESLFEETVRLRRCIKWYFLARQQTDNETACVMRWIGIESLLGDSNKERVVDRLSDRYAYILGLDSKTRKSLKKNFESQYKIRSKLMHGDEFLGDIKDDSKDMLERLIRIEVSNLIKSKNKILDAKSEVEEKYISDVLDFEIEKICYDVACQKNISNKSQISCIKFPSYKSKLDGSVCLNVPCRLCLGIDTYFFIVGCVKSDLGYECRLRHGPFLQSSV